MPEACLAPCAVALDPRDDAVAVVDAAVDRHGARRDRLVPVLQEVQHHYRYLPRLAMQRAAERLGVSPAEVYGVATFYAHFALAPRGRFIVRVCDGTACHVKGAGAIIDRLRAHLSLADGQDTSTDGLVTIESVSCLGACGLAPVLVIEEDVHGQVSVEEALRLIDGLSAS